MPKIEVDYIITRRIAPGEEEPGPGALRRPCSKCGMECWVAPRTVMDTELKPRIFCWECATPELLKRRTGNVLVIDTRK